MSIISITVKDGKMHKEAKISFGSSNIATIIGLNGHGKTKLLESISDQGSKNFTTQKKSTNKIEWEMNSRQKEDFENFEIFKDNKNFKDLWKEMTHILDITSWELSLKNLNQSISLRFKKYLKSMVKTNKKHVNSNFYSECYDQYLEMIKQHEDEALLGDWILEAISENEALNIGYSDCKSLINTTTQIASWHSEMSNAIKIRKIEYSPPQLSGTVTYTEIENGEIVMLSDNLYDFRPSWAENLFTVFGHPNKLKKIKNFDTKGKTNKLSEEISKQINDSLNQTELKVKVELNLEYNNTLAINVTFFEGGNQISWKDLSAGTQRFLSILFEIGSVEENTIFLLDEPDISLHPALQIELREKLEKYANDQKVKFIIATHSIHMTDPISQNANVYVTEKISNSEARLIPIETHSQENDDVLCIHFWNILGYRNEHEQTINSEDKVAIVEGPTDIIYIKEFAKYLNKDITGLKFVPAMGKDKIAGVAVNLMKIYDVPARNILCVFDKLNNLENFSKKSMDWLKEEGIDPYKTSFKDIEEVFAGKDAKKYQLLDENKKLTKKMKKAHEFVQRNKKELLEEQTVKNFEELIKPIMLFNEAQ